MPPGTIVSLRFHLERKGVRCTVREQGAAGDFRVSESAEVGQLLIELCAQLSSVSMSTRLGETRFNAGDVQQEGLLMWLMRRPT